MTLKVMPPRKRRGQWQPKQIESDELEAFCLHYAQQRILNSDLFEERLAESSVIPKRDPASLPNNKQCHLQPLGERAVDSWNTATEDNPNNNQDENSASDPWRCDVDFKAWAMWSSAKAVANKVVKSNLAATSAANGSTSSLNAPTPSASVDVASRRSSIKNLLMPKKKSANLNGSTCSNGGELAPAPLYEREALITELDAALDGFLGTNLNSWFISLKESMPKDLMEVDGATYRGIKNNNEDRILLFPSTNVITPFVIAPPPPSQPLETLNSSENLRASMDKVKLDDEKPPKSPNLKLKSALNRLMPKRKSGKDRAGSTMEHYGRDSPAPTSETPVPVGESSEDVVVVVAADSVAETPDPTTAQPNVSFFAVYDGHGGETTVEYIRTHLHVAILTHPSFPRDIPRAFRESFISVNQKWKRCLDRESSSTTSGSTATIAVIVDRTLHMAWVGDSPAFLIKGDASQPPEMLIRLHSAQDEEERKRVEARGGVFLRDGNAYRLNGLISVTRAFGDFRVESMIAEPEIVSIPLPEFSANATTTTSPAETGETSSSTTTIATDADQPWYLVISSDGLTDVVKLEEVAQFIRAREIQAAERNDGRGWISVGTAEVLATEAVDVRDSMDNVSVVIVRLS